MEKTKYASIRKKFFNSTKKYEIHPDWPVIDEIRGWQIHDVPLSVADNGRRRLMAGNGRFPESILGIEVQSVFALQHQVDLIALVKLKINAI